MPAAAAEAASKAVAAALRKPKASKQAADATSAGLADEQLLDDLDQALAEGQQREQQSLRSPATGIKPELTEERRSLDSKPSEGAALMASEQVSREASELGTKPKKPPPGFESVNGVVKPSSRAKKVRCRPKASLAFLPVLSKACSTCSALHICSRAMQINLPWSPATLRGRCCVSAQEQMLLVQAALVGTEIAIHP